MEPGSDQSHIVAIDVGGTSVKAALVGADLTPVTSTRVPTRRRDGTVEVEQISELIDELAGQATARGASVTAAGVVVPGVVDEQGVVRAAVNLGWRDLPLRQRLAERTSLPLRVGHDVRAGGLAEFTVGAAAGARNAMFMPIGTGIAASVLVDGHALVADGYAGEIGHVVVEPNGPLCACGQHGCLEPVSAASGIVRRYAERAGAPVRDAAEVVDRVRAGEAVAVGVWQDAIAGLATALTMAVTLLAPEVIVVGGGLAESGDVLLAPLREELAKRLTFQRQPTVVPASLGDNAGCIGAALLARQGIQ